jgi:hypothetical protein
MEPDSRDNSADPPNYDNDPDWLANAFAFDTLAGLASEHARTAG